MFNAIAGPSRLAMRAPISAPLRSLSTSRKVLSDVAPGSIPVAAAAESVAGSSPTTHYRITLRRSAIGLPSTASRSLQALGLTKRLQSVYRTARPETAGAILKLKELLFVENVRLLEGTDDVWVNDKGEVVDWGSKTRKAPRGYRVVGNVVDEERHRSLIEGSDAA